MAISLGFTVECNMRGFQVAKEIIQKLTGQIMDEEHKIQKLGMSTYFSDVKGQYFLRELEECHKVSTYLISGNDGKETMYISDVISISY